MHPDVQSAEGVAMYAGIDGQSGPPTLAIRHDSISRWDLGAAHELIHLLHFDLGEAALKEAHDILMGFQSPSANDDYANPHEMFAFFGQWYLAGHGNVIEGLHKPLYDFLEKHLGDARIEDPGWGTDGARGAIESLFDWFKSGQKPARG